MISRASHKMLAATLALLACATADFSPLSIHQEGWGLPLAAMGARERGMGEGGMAALSAQGYYLPNVSRTAFFQRTAFVATVEGDMDWLQDGKTSNRNMTYAVPTIGTFVKTQRYGTFGLHFQQAYQRRFSLISTGAGGIEQEYIAEGGLYLLGFSWAFAPIPILAIGFSEDFALGRDRFIDGATLAGHNGLPPEGDDLAGDTLEMRQTGNFPTLSLTVHTRFLDAAVAYTLGDELRSSNERRIAGLRSNPVASSHRVVPASVAMGLGWRASLRQTVALDFKTEDWKDDSLMNRAFKTSLGYEFRGSENPYEDFYKRLTLRAGLGQEILYLREIPEYFGTLGIGMPLGPRGHSLDVSLKYGHRGYDAANSFTEDYVKISASVVGVGVWGQPIRKRRR